MKEQANHFLQDRIDRYLAGQLSAEEQQQFETALAADNDLQADLHYRQDLKVVLKAVGREALRRELQELETGNAQTAAGRTRSLRQFQPWYLAVAAAVAILVAAVLLLYPDRQNPQELFAQNFQPYPNVLVPIDRSEGPSTQKPDAQAFAYYEQGEYAQALPLLEQLATDSTSAKYDFYVANCQLQLNQLTRAIPLLQSLAQSDTDHFAPHAQWYLALAYLKSADIPATQALLQTVSAQAGHPFQQQAEKLLREIPHPDNH